MQQWKIWVCLHDRKQKANIRNGQWKGGEIPKGHFMVCDGSCVKNTGSFFFSSIVCVHVQNQQLAYKNSAAVWKKKVPLSLQRMTSLQHLDIYCFCFAKLLNSLEFVSWMYVVFIAFFYADSAVRESQHQMKANGACVSLVSIWSNIIILYNKIKCQSQLSAERGLYLYNLTVEMFQSTREYLIKCNLEGMSDASERKTMTAW